MTVIIYILIKQTLQQNYTYSLIDKMILWLIIDCVVIIFIYLSITVTVTIAIAIIY